MRLGGPSFRTNPLLKSYEKNIRAAMQIQFCTNVRNTQAYIGILICIETVYLPEIYDYFVGNFCICQLSTISDSEMVLETLIIFTTQ